MTLMQLLFFTFPHSEDRSIKICVTYQLVFGILTRKRWNFLSSQDWNSPETIEFVSPWQQTMVVGNQLLGCWTTQEEILVWG